MRRNRERLLRFFLFILSGVRTAEALVEVKAVELTVTNLQRSKSFFEDVLEFKEVASSKNSVRESAQLRLGEEFVVLSQYASPAPMAEHRLAANATLFQHLAIVVSNMDLAFQKLLQSRVEIVSAGPQRLPVGNRDAAGIQALYFRDPDEHFLELIEFPSSKGEPRWQQKGKVFSWA